MLPEARGENLVYVSDSWTTGNVYVFSYPMGKRVGTLTGFYFPTGECVDKHGNVWILNLSPAVIVEYAHGGTTPIATLNDPVYGFSCSIDPTTGNLAISSGDPAEVAVYANAAGTPTIYTYSGAASLASCAYDDSGNLFIDSSNAAHPFAELPKGGKSIIAIKYPNDEPLGHMQWDGRYLAVQERTHGGQGPITIDRVQVVGTSATLKSQTFLYANRNKQEESAVQFWITADKIVMPTPSRSREDPVLNVWNYPVGGDPFKRFRARGSYQLFGVAVSPKR